MVPHWQIPDKYAIINNQRYTYVARLTSSLSLTSSHQTAGLGP
jgi:hypothetical protein